MPKKSSSNDLLHPYLTVRFWKENRFWLAGNYSKKGAEYMESRLQAWTQEEKALSKIDNTIK